MHEKKLGKSYVWLIPLLSMALGTTIGAVSGITRYHEPVIKLAGHEATADAVAPPTKDAKPRVNLPGPTTYDFGVMGRNEEQSHTFLVRNIGNGPLTLKVLDTTCKCTVGSIGNETIQAGKTEEVTLTWETKSYDREFRQSATIETNDQSQRELIFSVYGKVLQLAMPDLPRVKLGRVSRSEPQEFVTTVYGYRDTDLVITGHTFSHEDIGDFFEVTHEPLPKDEWADAGAKSAIRVRVKILPGLPVGANRQIIALETNKLDIAPMDVAVEITVISDLSLLGGRNLDDDHNLLKLGSVPQDVGVKTQLFLIAKGKFKEDVSLSVAELDPAENLAVEFGEPVDLANGNTRRIPVRISVLPHGPAVKRMGSKQGALGSIVLNTNHPEIPEFEIKVQFAVRSP